MKRCLILMLLLGLLLTGSAARRGVVAIQDAAIKVCRHEIDKCYEGKQDCRGCIEPIFFQYIHYYKIDCCLPLMWAGTHRPQPPVG